MRTKGIGGIYAMEDKPKSKCRKWKIKISVGINPATGKYAQRAMTFHGSYTEAVQARDEPCRIEEDDAQPMLRALA